jgi:hypothetical protein
MVSAVRPADRIGGGQVVRRNRPVGVEVSIPLIYQHQADALDSSRRRDRGAGGPGGFEAVDLRLAGA